MDAGPTAYHWQCVHDTRKVVGRTAVSSAGRGRHGDRDRSQGPLRDRAAPPADRHHPGLHQLADPERLDDPQEVLELALVADDLDGDGVGGDVDDLGAEQLDDLEDLPTGYRVRLHL